MKGCINCRHYISKLGDRVDMNGNFDIHRKCQQGQTQTMNDWWNKNGHKPTSKIFTDLSCHEYHESTLLLKDINKTLDDLIYYLKKTL